MRIATGIGASIVLVVLLLFSGGLALILNPREGSRLALGYDYPPLRTLTVTSTHDVIDLVVPLRQWAIVNGYKTKTGLPTGQAASITFEAWNGIMNIGVNDRVGDREPPGLWLGIYWNGDMADDAAVNRVAEQMAGLLARFGPVVMTSASLGTPPRDVSANFWRRPYLLRLFDTWHR